MTYDPQGNPGYRAPEGSDRPPPPGYPGSPPPPPNYPGSPPPPPGYPGNYQPGWTPPPPPTPTYPPTGQYGGGYQQPGATYGGYQPGYYPPAPKSTEGTAIAALVLAIASFVICPVIPAIVALAMVPGARRKIVSSGGTLEGLGILTAAKIVSWINIALWVVLGIGWVILVIIIGTTSSTTNSGAIIGPLLGR